MSEQPARLGVTRGQAALFRIVRAIFGFIPAASVRADLLSAHAFSRLSNDALDVLEDELQRGLVASLVTLGGFVDRVDEAGRGGALWERVEAPHLVVGAPSMRLLAALVKTPLAETHLTIARGSSTLSCGDELFFLLVARLLAEVGLARVLEGSRPVFAKSFLARLAFPCELESTFEAHEWRRWAEGTEAVLIDAVHLTLRNAWVRAGKLRRDAVSAAGLEEATLAMRRTLGSFVQEAMQRERFEAVLFLLDAARLRMSERGGVHRWLGPMTHLRIDERGARAALGEPLLEAALSLEAVLGWARAQRHFDDGYARAQRLLGALGPWSSGGFEALRAELHGLLRMADVRALHAH